jgi:hypothetical protein
MRWRAVPNIMAIFVRYVRIYARFALRPALLMPASISIVRNAKRHVKPAPPSAKSMRPSGMPKHVGGGFG